MSSGAAHAPGRTAADLVTLLDRVARQDRVAFAALYDATSSKLYGIVLRILKRRDAAEDVVQEVYVKIWDRAATFDAARASPITWMATIARNRALDEVRRRQTVSIEDHPEVLDTPTNEVSALATVIAGETGQKLTRCLGGLDAERRDMVVLAYCDGLSRDELAQKFGQPVNTIKTWLRRALLQLKDCLGS